MSCSAISTICSEGDTCTRLRHCHRSWARKCTRSARTKPEKCMALRMKAGFRMTSRRAFWQRRPCGRFLLVEVWGITATTNGSSNWGTYSRQLHLRGETVNLIVTVVGRFGTVLEDGDERKGAQE